MLTIIIKQGTQLLEKAALHFQIPEYIAEQQGLITYKIQIELNLLIKCPNESSMTKELKITFNTSIRSMNYSTTLSIGDLFHFFFLHITNNIITQTFLLRRNLPVVSVFDRYKLQIRHEDLHRQINYTLIKTLENAPCFAKT